ncbi:MAG: glycosyltransferase [Streptococcaceae bacterium]|jgi:glycosyltransferase involved in cell wall biosynthesis|nr:glycosyltransferase [Streptococcaceae bacterium]
MKILHYGLGYPPERSGGLVQYVTDLMTEQFRQGNSVVYLFPGRINLFDRRTKIKKGKERIPGIVSYELINSLPLAVFGGIKEPEKFMTSVDENIYENFLNELEPDIIHVHTLMGLHQEFFTVANRLKIKIVYTSHDYFGLSPNPTFYFSGKSWDDENSLNYWLNVSQAAMSVKKLRALQSSFYPKLRDIVKKFKKDSFQKEAHYSIKSNSEYSENQIVSFNNLKDYYQNIFEKIDNFHFNSTVAKEVFEKNLRTLPKSSFLLSISNADIHGGKKHISLDMGQINKITYIGQYAEFKGFYDFLELAKRNPSLHFEIYGEDINPVVPYNVKNRKRFASDEKMQVFKDIQLLIVPSRWKETFNFLTIEALDKEVPVFVLENVGAKDLLPSSFILKGVREMLLSGEYRITYKIDSFTKHSKKIESEYMACLSRK